MYPYQWMRWIPSNGAVVHCKDKMPKIWNKYSQKRNIGVSVPISTFMCLWTNYIFPRWVCIFCWRNYVDRSWKYINRSQTQECGNWGWGRAIPRKGIYKRNCRCSVVDEIYYVALRLAALTVDANSVTVLGSTSIPASYDSVGFNGRQMKQCWTKYMKIGWKYWQSDSKSDLEPHIFKELHVS